MLKRLIYLVIFTAATPIGHANDLGVPLSFSVSPNQCIVADDKKSCSVTLTFNWINVAEHDQVCLYQQEVSLKCFSAEINNYEMIVLMNEDMNFYLKKANSDDPLAHASVSMLKRTRLNLYNRYVPWRVF